MAGERVLEIPDVPRSCLVAANGTLVDYGDGLEQFLLSLEDDSVSETSRSVLHPAVA